jgi:GntR family transcriptional regulator of vanillate catabolism
MARPATRSLNVTEILREKLLRGDFAPGSHLQEVALAEQLAVSRTPIREALRLLQQEGLVLYHPNRGYVVKDFALADILAAFDVRGVLEGLAARRMARSGVSDVARQTLIDCLAEGDHLLEIPTWSDTEYATWRSMNTRFHACILDNADSTLLVRFCEDAGKIPVVFNGSFRWYRRQDFRRSHDHHHVIAQALLASEGDRAEWTMREHIRHAAEIIKAHHQGGEST